VDRVRDVRILNGAFDPLTLERAADELVRAAHAGERGYLCTVNVAILMMMRSSPRLQRFVDRARWVVADGQPLIWSARLAGTPLPERVAGVDLVGAVCARCRDAGLGVYFLGSTRATLDAAVAALRAAHPGLDVRGTADGYFAPAEAEARARAVAGSGARVLFVAMGVPRQEGFLEDQWDRLGAAVAVPVGGSFDVIAGVRRRAPPLLQRVGLEWAYRLAQEPRRLFRRYLVTNVQFLALITGALVRGLARRVGVGAPHRGRTDGN
jgi:N-acetylglucosaminyldiphosphoundecaprenol N-acetyl-beta-D-mannosaminyltransferase